MNLYYPDDMIRQDCEKEEGRRRRYEEGLRQGYAGYGGVGGDQSDNEDNQSAGTNDSDDEYRSLEEAKSY